jgi:hypothetical protein
LRARAGAGAKNEKFCGRGRVRGLKMKNLAGAGATPQRPQRPQCGVFPTLHTLFRLFQYERSHPNFHMGFSRHILTIRNNHQQSHPYNCMRLVRPDENTLLHDCKDSSNKNPARNFRKGLLLGHSYSDLYRLRPLFQHFVKK